MTEQQQIIMYEQLFHKLGRLVTEVKVHEQRKEFKQATVKTKQLKILVTNYFELSKTAHLTIDGVIDRGLDFLRGYLLHSKADKLKTSECFNKFDQAVQDAALELSEDLDYLNHNIAVIAVKYGFLVAIINSNATVGNKTKWNSFFKSFLKDYGKLDDAKLAKTIRATNPLASYLVNFFIPGMLRELYVVKIFDVVNKLIETLAIISKCYPDEMFQDFEKEYRPLLKQVRLISTLKQQEKESELKIVLEKLNKCFVQDYGATPEHVEVFGQSLEIHEELFELEVISYLLERSKASLDT